MLDNTVVLWGSAHPHASHSTKDYPIQIAGGNRLGFKHGNLHNFEGDRKKPLSNLFVSMLNAVDEAGFGPLFDGKTTAGWTNLYKWGEAVVVDGVVTTDVEDDMDASGAIGIQHHGEKGQTYMSRNLRIKELE